MPATFFRTTRALDGDRSRLRTKLVFLGPLFAAWILWFGFGRVNLYEVTDKARLEVEHRVHGVAAPVGGRVQENHVTLGREVAAGEVLVRLDSETEELALAEKRVRREALAVRLRALQKEIQAEQEAVPVQRQARIAAVAEARAQVTQAQARAQFAQQQLETSYRLWQRQALSLEEYNRAQAEVTATQAQVQSLQLAATRLDQDRLVQESERAARLAKLQREAAELQGELSIEDAAIRRLEHDIELRTVRAPVAGRIGESADFPPGSVVPVGERLGAVIPLGSPRVVALFPVASAGRLTPGQPARLRLDGYPWTQYGTLAATVDRVANEPQSGLLRVELTVIADPTSTIPLEHGLPGAVEVQVDQIAPAVLVLRAAGQFLPARRSSDPNL